MLAVDGSRLAVWSSMRMVIRGGVRSVVRLCAVAIAARLLVPRVDVSTAGADAAGEQGTVVVIAACVATSPQDQRARGQDTAANRLPIQRVGPPAPAAGVVIAVSPLGEAVLIVALISHHRGMRTVAEPPRVPIHISGPGGPGTTPLDASEAVALVDAAERPGDIEQLVVDRVAYGGRAIKAMIGSVRAWPITIVVIVPIVIVPIVIVPIVIVVAVGSLALLWFAVLPSIRLTVLMFTLLEFTSLAVTIAVISLFSFAILTDTLTRLLGL